MIFLRISWKGGKPGNEVKCTEKHCFVKDFWPVLNQRNGISGRIEYFRVFLPKPGFLASS